MVNLLDLVEQKEFTPALFCLCSLFFVFPLFMLTPEKPLAIFLSFFIPWLLVIFILFLVSRGCKSGSTPEEGELGDEGDSRV